jgi:hypothetical protein
MLFYHESSLDRCEKRRAVWSAGPNREFVGAVVREAAERRDVLHFVSVSEV